MTGPAPKASVSWAGDRFLRVALPAAEPGLVRAACARLRAAGVAGVVDLTPASATILVTFGRGEPRDGAAAERAVAGALEGLRAGEDEVEEIAPRIVEIPVCYEGAFAPDLEALARERGVRPEDVAALHSGAEYTVEFVGFAPGFGYLVGLPAALAAARLETPRARVPAGSVGIAGDRTAVYPGATPGGWRLIGRTPRRMFDARREAPSLLTQGDRVRFRRIDAGEFAALAEGER